MDDGETAPTLTAEQVMDELNTKWQQGRYSGLARLSFSDWVPWSQREKLNGLDKVGVYVLGKRDGGLSGRADFLGGDVIYVGKTNDGKTTSLRSRLGQFNRSAFQDGGGHAGGHSYRDLFGADQGGLCVSVCPVHWSGPSAIPDPVWHKVAVILVVTRLEVCLRGLYVYRWGTLPKCNKE
jgi:hypothetical protein